MGTISVSVFIDDRKKRLSSIPISLPDSDRLDYCRHQLLSNHSHACTNKLLVTLCIIIISTTTLFLYFANWYN